MNVQLISYTPDALELLIATKETRLGVTPDAMRDIKAWTWDRKMEELAYMRRTIQSSWEFCTYVFAVSGVSRAFTHQFVRTRHGSYAQQSQRTVRMDEWEFVFPRTLETSTAAADLLEDIRTGYHDLLEDGVRVEDARAFLPTNIETNIVGQFNLRTLSEMARVRLCFRTQGEYQNVFAEMRERVIEVHPWAEDFLEVACVATGVCAFPRWNECPIKGPVFNPATGLRYDEQNTERAHVLHRIAGVREKVEEVNCSYPARPSTSAETKERWEATRKVAR